MILPTLACIDYLNIERDIREMDRAGVDYFHIDMMDGNFVPNLCINYDMIKAIRSISATPMDVHIMALNPFDYIDRLAALGVELISTHVELLDDLGQWVAAVKAKGARAGVVLSPQDSVESVLPHLAALDLVLVMGVTPGFAGQQFQPSALHKLATLAQHKAEHKLDFIIEVDGGVSWDNAADCVNAGAELLVAGVFAVFNQKRPLGDCCVEFAELSRKK